MPHPTTLKTYSERAKLHNNPTAKHLLELMERKKSNLCVSVDVTSSAEVLEIVKRVGRSVCMVKTHIDIIEDFTPSLTEELTRLSKELDFVIFEDRKFADIGNTVSLQYSSGVHKIASWSDITNAHPLPGPGIIQGLSVVGKPLGRGLLLLAEMSSANNLLHGSYTSEAVRMARKAGREFVIGFIAMSRVEEKVIPRSVSAGQGSKAAEDEKVEEGEDWIIMTPGVQLATATDGMGQQYRTPHQVVYESGCDVIIVGRGIYGIKGEKEIVDEAERYRVEGWTAYEKRLARS